MKRFLELLSKFCSVKGILVLMVSVAFFMGMVSEYSFMAAWGLFIGSRELYKLVNKGQ